MLLFLGVENREERMRVDAKLTFSSNGCSMELLMPMRLMGFTGG